MTPPADLVDRLLIEHSAETTLRTLKAGGYDAPIHRLHIRISQLIASGRRVPKKQTDRTPFHSGSFDVPKGSSLEGSERLLRAQIRAGQVFPASMARWEARHGRVELAA